jgi:hypothetical protein
MVSTKSNVNHHRDTITTATPKAGEGLVPVGDQERHPAVASRLRALRESVR